MWWKTGLNKLRYGLLYTVVYGHALLPFSVLYRLSDGLFYLVYYVARYRRRQVRTNLCRSFPEKNLNEIIAIEKAFYRDFCDYWFETMKVLRISREEMQRRMHFEGMEVLNQVLREHDTVLMYLGHYGNWEWVPSITMYMEPGVTTAQIYRPLKEKAFDTLFLTIRKCFGSVGIAKEDTLRTILRMRRKGKKLLVGFMSDQTPSPRNIHYWSRFLNQETALFTGVERIARKTKAPVVYLDVQRIKRGYYTAQVVVLNKRPQDTEEFAITEQYIRCMEKTILRDPAYWLWSHKRWKYQLTEDNSIVRR